MGFGERFGYCFKAWARSVDGHGQGSTALSLSPDPQLTWQPEAGRPGGPRRERRNPPLTALSAAGAAGRMTKGHALTVSS